jgi:autonomous glycyl radical cofactor GrcA
MSSRLECQERAPCSPQTNRVVGLQIPADSGATDSLTRRQQTLEAASDAQFKNQRSISHATDAVIDSAIDVSDAHQMQYRELPKRETGQPTRLMLGHQTLSVSVAHNSLVLARKR